MENNNMTPEQIRSKMVTMRDRISVLEWDEQHDQINPYMKVKLTVMKKEFKELEEKLGTVVLPK